MSVGEANEEKRISKWAWASFGVVFSLIILNLPLLLFGVPLSSCNKCHEMEPYFRSWKASSHGAVKINCESCHVKPGFVPEYIFKLNFYPWILGRIGRGGMRPMGVVPASTEACRRCHSLNRKVSTSGDLKIDHEEHIVKAKLGCPKCHGGVIHPGVGKLGSMNPPRKLCKECHKKEMKKCAYCHIIDGKGELKQFKH